MLDGVDLLLRDFLATAQLGVLSLLDVGQKVLLGLTALEGAILLGVHGQLEEFLVVLSIVPSVLVHLLAESVEGILQECMGIDIGKLQVLLGSQLLQFGRNLARHLAALAEDHAPDSIVHHHIAALALFHREEVHQGDVLRILRERRYQWGITHLRPDVFYLVEQLHQHVVHRQLRLTLLGTQFVDHGLDATQVSHHRAHHTTRQSATQEE